MRPDFDRQLVRPSPPAVWRWLAAAWISNLAAALALIADLRPISAAFLIVTVVASGRALIKLLDQERGLDWSAFDRARSQWQSDCH